MPGAVRAAVFAATRSVGAHPAHTARPLANCASTYTAYAADTGQLQHNNILTDAFLKLQEANDDPGYVCSIQGEAEYWTSSGTQDITVGVELCASHNHDWCSNLVYNSYQAITATTTGSLVSTSVDTVSSGGTCNTGYTWSSYGSWNDTSGTSDGDVAYGQSFCP